MAHSYLFLVFLLLLLLSFVSSLHCFLVTDSDIIKSLRKMFEKASKIEDVIVRKAGDAPRYALMTFER